MMFPIQAAIFAILPSVEGSVCNSPTGCQPILAGFSVLTALACAVLLCYGGGFGTMPAFVADYFGAENVGAIYGLMLTAWGFAGVLGPTLIAGLRQSTGQYNEALYVIAGLMLLSTAIPVFVGAPAHGTHPPQDAPVKVA